MQLLRLAGAMLAIILLTAASASATTTADGDLERQAAAASTILRGSVAEVRQVMVGRVPHTEVVLMAREWLKGAERKSVVVRVPGGTWPDGSRLVVEGLPSFTAGDDVCLLLNEAPGLRVPIVGLNRGYYKLAKATAKDAEPRIFDHKGRSIAGVDGTGRVTRSAKRVDALDWSTFRAILRGYVR